MCQGFQSSWLPSQTPGIDRLSEVRQYELVTNVPENLDENVRKWLPTMRFYRNKVI